MAATFGGAGWVFLSELIIRNGLDGPAAQGSLIGFLAVMVGGCVTLILAENKKKKTTISWQKENSAVTDNGPEIKLESLTPEQRDILRAAMLKTSI